MSFIERLEKAAKKNNTLLCVGLDTDIKLMPKHLLGLPHPIFSFNRAIIKATHDLVCCYKPNIAFYEAQGTMGMRSLRYTIDFIHEKYPEIPVILDAKRGDIGQTDKYYAQAAFEMIKADAITANPYHGFDSIIPFLEYRNKGVIILCRTSNPGAADFQDLKVKNMKLYQFIARSVVKWNNKYGNCLLVVGATWPNQMAEVRDIAKKMWFLVPGMGAQGGSLEPILKQGLRKDGLGLIINASRSIIYSSNDIDFAESARKEAIKMKDAINNYR